MKKNSNVKKIKQKRNADAWDFFDDCAICKAMKNADLDKRSLSIKELQEVFEEVNKKQKISK